MAHGAPAHCPGRALPHACSSIGLLNERETMQETYDTRRSRRLFLGQLAALAHAAFLGKAAGAGLLQGGPEDKDIYLETMLWATGQQRSTLPVGDAAAAFGQHFLGKPYVGHTLEAPGDEHLVINLREFDCLTFVENMLALARCVKSGERGFDAFQRQLTTIRYRGGVIDGYPSRLHYFSDWVNDNVKKGIVENLTRNLGGKSYRKAITFMTTHAESYRQLERKDFVRRVAEREKVLSRERHYHIPSDRIAGIQNRLQNGDLIGTTTTMEGMDVSHTGMVLRQGNVVRFMHASLSGKNVLVSPGSLAEYVTGISSHTGIIVLRPLEPRP